MKEKLVKYLQQFVTESRLQVIDRVLQQRTRYITVVLEDIYQSHNASAVLRSCECLGIQDVHIIENRNQYQVNPDVALGSSKWLSLYKYNGKEKNTGPAVEYLKSQGYRIIATTPDPGSEPVGDLDLNQGKIALLFGTEMEGLSCEAVELSDMSVRIPLYGFTRSYNISVAAAIILYDLVSRLHKTSISWNLDEKELLTLKLQWLRNSIRHPDLIDRFLIDNQKFDSEG